MFHFSKVSLLVLVHALVNAVVYVLLYCGIVYFACREYVCVYACTCAQVHISVLYKVFMNCCLVTSLVKY